LIAGRKQFFFEKKNQKTFAKRGRAHPVKPKPKYSRVFCCFFLKKKFFLSLLFLFAPLAYADDCPAVAPMPVPLLPHTRTALAANQPLIIVALGSSSTRGWMATDIAHSYPALLQRELNAAFPKGVFAVINRGIGGQDAPEELARLDSDVLVIHPQLVIWQVGANGAVRDASPDVFKRLVAEGIDKIKAAGADLILMDNQRSPRVMASPEHKIIEAAMGELAADAGVNLFSRGTLMDRWAAAGAPYDDFVAPDGLHMNNRGYTCMARALADSIIAALRQPIAQQRPRPTATPAP
jgi:lysophospholipase L1-like esterase